MEKTTTLRCTET